MREKHRGRQCGVLPRSALALLVLGMGIAAAPSALAADAVDIALVLAADVSRSVDEDEFKLQREGYANAFSDPRVMKAIQAGPMARSRSASSNGRAPPSRRWWSTGA